MLAQFSVGNFRSFKETVTLSLVAARVHARHKELETNLFAVDDELSLLKSAVIYGANASGKSNLLKAFAFMRDFVINSARESSSTDPISVEPFALSTETENQPSFFEAVFYIAQRRYRYGFIADRQRIHEEWLYHTQKRETKLFTRVGKQISISQGFKEGQGLTHFVRDNALFLSVVDKWNGTVSHQILKWFMEIGFVSGIDDESYVGLSLQQLATDGSLSEPIRNFIKELDLGIQNITAEYHDLKKESTPIPEMRPYSEIHVSPKASYWARVMTTHKKYNEQLMLVDETEFSLSQHESEGTQKLFSLTGIMMNGLSRGQIIILDEMDTRLHPLLTREIVKLFHSPETNRFNAQLIFTTHDTNLLSNQLFRRDQVWFTEKDQYGGTNLYSLAEFKVRQDASFASDYIMGRYGAIPYLGNVEQIVSHANEA
jgi:AAA15 family ATPase/GTPase